MKRNTILSILVLLAMVLVMMPASLVAQEGDAPGQLRAPRPDDAGLPVPEHLQPEWGGVWQYGPDTGFQFTRFDGGYYPGDGMVYFMGGRLVDSGTDGSVWSFDASDYTYADMGVDLVTPISNYTMNLLQDDAGTWGFYTFCGRPDAGGTINAVQVYYPDSNTAVQLDPADDFPAEGCTSALNVVLDNKVYVAGGFDPEQTPANWDYTYVFDPTAPQGSRWTLLDSATLSTARAYMMGAAVDGKIYAIGGNWFDGAALVNVTTVEVLDPYAPTPVWDDAAAADLPEACSESRAYGFNWDSPYTDPDGTPMAQWIVTGCGSWPDENNYVYVYDTAFDFWEAFPYLNDARRDHAAEFIPEAGGLEEFGMPAMWVWGGIQGGDANVLVTSEYYDVLAGPAECDVLLVDDDWDFTADHPESQGGRPFYTTALDNLGFNYDVWDTVSMGTPTFADMGAYQAVVWFTGYDWETPVTPEEEAELTAYLDNGGNVFMSNQEQFYAYGMTPMWDSYFWADSYTEDVVLLGTEGNPSDPLYAGLGPYDMGRPDEFGVYWPVEGYEGPYDDEVWVKAGGFEPMFYNDSGNPNGTRFEGAGFRTVYLGYPVEWLPDLGARDDVLGTALNWFCEGGPGGEFDLIPPGQTGSGVPGEVVEYTLTLANNMGMDETFDLTYASVWDISGPGTVGPVPDGGSESFSVFVTIPPDAGCYEVDTAEVTAAAQSDPGLTDTSYIETTADPPGTGDLEGYIYDLNYGTGIQDAHIGIEFGDEFEAEAWTDGTGFYYFEDVPACEVEGEIAAYGYYLEYPVYIGVEPGTTTQFDITLAAADPEWSPEGGLSVTLLPDSSDQEDLTFGNVGSGNLNFHISEVPDDAGYPLRVTIPPLAPQGVDPQVYADLAASPDGSTTIIAYMAEQADLSAAFAIEDWSERGQYVFDTLRATAASTQAGLRASLDGFGKPYESRYIVNAIVMEADANIVSGIAALPEVAYVGANVAIEAPSPVEMSESMAGVEAVVWNILQVNADDVWSAFGATGDGITVANIDTGVDYDHPALTNQYRGNLGGSYDHNYNWWDPYGYGPVEPYDWHNHGSHTIGTMVGDDGGANQIGMAPAGTWYACQGFDQNTGYGYTAELLTCGEFILAPWDLSGANPDPNLRADVVNNSWGGGQAEWWYNQIVYAWRAAGIFPAWSAGNEGPACGTAGEPGDMPNSIAAGATDSSDNIASFSSRGPAVISGITKPNISAPGVNTVSAYRDGTYGLMSGTSMASPHVAGEVALIWSAVPELRGDVQLTQWVIEQSALPILDDQCGDPNPPNNVYGWGRIDAFDAVTMADAGSWDIPWLSIDPVSGVVEPGGSTDVALTFDSTGLGPDCYTADLKIEFNDPYVTELFYPVELCVVTGEDTMHVGGIEGYFSRDYLGRPRLRMHVYVEDETASPLGDVLVDASITVPCGGPFDRSRYTKPSGNARFHWGCNLPGTWQICVDDLTRTGYIYSPGDNVVTCMDWELVGP